MTPAVADPGPRRRDAGLTLVEVLVALAIFSVIGLAGLSILDTVVRVNRGTEDRLERLARIDRALLVVGRDLLQVEPGGVTLGEDGLGFRRSGADGPIRIAYALRDGALIRTLPGREGDIPQMLLDDVASLDWRLLGADRAWRESLPADSAPPVAAELTLTLPLTGRTDPARIARVFVLPESARR